MLGQTSNLVEGGPSIKHGNMETQNIILKASVREDAKFITQLFADSSVRRFYRVADELDGNAEKLIDFWANETRRNLGQTWIIHHKKNGLLNLFGKTSRCGIVAFVFHGNRKKARISYALLKEYRGRGIVQEAVALMEKYLMDIGVEVLEADISRENLDSVKLIEKEGFTRGNTAFIDTDLEAKGIHEFRHVWHKRILSYTPETDIEFHGRLGLDTIRPLFNEYQGVVAQEGNHPELKARLFYLNGLLEYKDCDNEAAFNSFKYSELLSSNHNILYWMARTAEHLGEYDDAAKYCQMSLQVYEEINGTADKDSIIGLMEDVS